MGRPGRRGALGVARPVAGGGSRWAAPGTILLPWSKATVLRGSDGSYYTSAVTRAWAGNHVLRMEDRGDGLGPIALIERSRTNNSYPGSAVDQWPTAGSNTTITADQGTDIYGSTMADRIVFNGPTGGYSRYQTRGGPVAGDKWVLSCFAIADTPDDVAKLFRFVAWRTSLGNNQTAGAIKAALTAAWKRFESAQAAPATASYYLYYEHSLNSPDTGDAALPAVALRASGHQWERGAYATSHILTTTGVATRAADVVSFATGDVPKQALEGPARFRQYVPEWQTSDLASGEIFYLLSLDANNCVRLRHDGTGLLAECVQGGAVKVVTSGYVAVAGTRGSQALDVSWNPDEGWLKLAGATSGNGTFNGTRFAFPSGGTLRVGGLQGGSNEINARISELEAA